MVKEEIVAKIHEMNQRHMLLTVSIIIVILIVAILSLSVAQIKVGIIESFCIFIDGVMGVEPDNFMDHLKMYVVYENNTPRAIGAIFAGATLAVGGAVLQNIIRNPLADPYTLGISSGALFGMVISVTTGFCILPFINDDYQQFVNSFVFALIPTAVIVLVSMFKKVSPTMMILCGIATMYIFTACSTMIKYTMDPDAYAMIYTWSVGSVNNLQLKSIPKMVFGFLITIIPLWIWHSKIDVIAQGDNQAITLGVNPNLMRILCLVFISIGTSIIVCHTGTIGFVGLVAPHIARRFVGSGCRQLIPASAALGGLMVLGSDVVMRLLEPGLPVGVMIALICSPIFIIILVKMKKNAW